jgi:beta-glucan synthesis-associated protein KRE6
VRNQSIPGVGPDIPKEDGDKYTDGFFSFQQGQRLSACTCDSDSDLHPGPKRKGDSKRNFVGRSAPEIDIFEAQVSQYEDPDTGLKHQYGEVSQSAQWAPFNPKYLYDNGTGNVVVNDWTISRPNSYSGGV